MNVYQIFQNAAGERAAVKFGFSWPGFLLGWIWALARRLWLAAVLLLVAHYSIFVLCINLRGTSLWVPGALGLMLACFVGFKLNGWLRRQLLARDFVPIGAMKAR